MPTFTPPMKGKKKMPRKPKPKTYVAMILDSSGSMFSIKDEARAHFNEQVQELRQKSEEHDVKVTLTTFNGNVDIKRFNKPIGSVEELSDAEYQPSGSTALYDAIGETVAKIRHTAKDLEKDHVSVLVLIITDGYENSSREYSQGTIKNQIAALEENGWTFTFMGANVDPLQIQQDFGISAGNYMSFTSNKIGTEVANATRSAALDNFMSRKLGGQRVTKGFYSEVSKDSE